MRILLGLVFILSTCGWFRSTQRRMDYYSGYSFNNLPRLLKKDIIISFVVSVVTLIALVII